MEYYWFIGNNTTSVVHGVAALKSVLLFCNQTGDESEGLMSSSRESRRYEMDRRAAHIFTR